MAMNFQERFKFIKGLIDKTKTEINDVFEKNRDTKFIKFITNSITVAENVLKAINTVLKEKGIDIEKFKENTTELLEKAKSKATFALDTLKEIGKESFKSLPNSAKESIVKTKDRITGFIKKFKTSPPEENATETKAEKADVVNEKPTKGFFANLKDKFTQKPKTTEERIKDDIERTNKAIEKQEKKAKAKKEYLDKFKERMKKETPKKDNFFSKLMGSLMKFGGFLLGGIKTIFSKVAGWLGGFIVSGISKFFSILIPSAVKSIGSLVSEGLKKLVSPSTLWEGVKTGSRLLWTGAKVATSILGRLGLTALRFAGPVGLVATGVYLAYKFYKYLTQNDTGKGIPGLITRLRLKQYGFNDLYEKEYHKVFELEMHLKDFVKFKRTGIDFKKLNQEQYEKVYDLFGISTDEEDKELRALFDNWFANRFLPVFFSHIKSLYSINPNIYLDELEKLKPEQFKTYIESLNVPTKIYLVKTLPFRGENTIVVTKEEIEQYINEIKTKINEEVKNTVKDKEDKKAFDNTNKEQEKKVKEELNKTKNETKKYEENKAKEIIKPKPINKEKTNIGSKEIEDKKVIEENKTVKEALETTKVKVENINKAEGNLVQNPEKIGINIDKVGKERYYNLNPNFRELFEGMAKEYNSITGKDIVISEAFRTEEDQRRLYEKYKDRGGVAKPGSSIHEYGLAVDIPSSIANELEKYGLMRKYGFTRPIGREPWHLEPIGVSLNPTEAKKDINFRNAAIISSPGKGGSGFGTIENLPKDMMGKRNYDMQKEIYFGSKEKIVDIEKFTKDLAEKYKSGDIKPSETKEETILAKSSIETPKTKDTALTNKEKSNTENKGLLSNTIEEKLPNKETIASIEKEGAIKDIESNKNLDISKYKDLSIDESIQMASKLTGVDENILRAFAQLESSFNARAASKTSSAQGLFQFTKNTWKELLDKYGSKYNIPENASRENPFYSALMTGEYIKYNLKQLKSYKEGTGLDDSTIAYIAHHYGANGAKKILTELKQNPDNKLKNIISEEAYKANMASIKDKSVNEYIRTIDYKYRTALDTVGASSAKPIKAVYKTEDTKSAGLIKISSTEPSYISSFNNEMRSSYATTYTPTIGKANEVKTVKEPVANKSLIETDKKEKIITPKVETNKITVDTGNMESILSQQLNTLNNVLSVLSLINNKIDIEKIKEIMTPKETINKSQPKHVTTLSNTGINMSREKYST